MAWASRLRRAKSATSSARTHAVRWLSSTFFSWAPRVFFRRPGGVVASAPSSSAAKRSTSAGSTRCSAHAEARSRTAATMVDFAGMVSSSSPVQASTVCAASCHVRAWPSSVVSGSTPIRSP